MTITIIRSKQIPDTVELVAQGSDWLPDDWGVRHRDSNRIVCFMEKEEAITHYEGLQDELDVEDFFGFKPKAA